MAARVIDLSRVVDDLFDRLLPIVERMVRRATVHVGQWGEVTETGPVRVRFAGVGEPVRVGVAVGVTVSVGDRVAVDRRGGRHYVAYVIEEAS